MALLSAAVGITVALATTSDDQQRSAPLVQVSDPDNSQPGELNQSAVERVRAYDALPLLWLGEEFSGYKLVAFQVRDSEIPPGVPWAGGRTKAILATAVYGTCDPNRTPDAPSCVPPLSIVYLGPGLAQAPAKMEPRADSSSPYTSRGVASIDAGTGTILYFDNGYAVTVHSDSGIRKEAVAALRLANPGAFGLKAIGPGEDLRALGALPLP